MFTIYVGIEGLHEHPSIPIKLEGCYINIQNKTPRKLFDEYKHLAPTTLKKTLYNPHELAKKYTIEYDDLLQYAYTGLWTACVNYNNTKSSFQTFAINNIRWSVLSGLNRECSLIKYDVNNPPSDEDTYQVISIDATIEQEDGNEIDRHETIPDDENIEEKAINKLISDELLQTLTDREKKIIHMKFLDMTETEIADQLNVTKQAINKAYHNIQKKVRKED